MESGAEFKILMLEDRSEDCELIQRVLVKEGFKFTLHRVDTENGMLRELREFKPDMIISDYVMPGFDAIKALGIAQKAAPDVPVIVVSGTVGEETAADAIRNGASDYVMKDNLKRLGPAVRRELQEIDRRHKARQIETELRKRLQNAEQMETLGKLAGKVAHDLNNILGPIVAYPDLILEQLPSDSPVRDDILEIRKSAEHAAEIIKDLLTLARRGNFQPGSISLNTVVRNYMKSLGFIALRNKLPEQQVECRLDDALPDILGSAPHLQAVIMNLIINAFDASKGEPVIVSTRSVVLDKPLNGYEKIPAGHYAVLSVADKGHGIDPDDMKRLLEPFFSRKDMGNSGTGLGLTIIFGILKDHQGYIDIISEVESGTEFILYFPAANAETPQPAEKDISYEGTETILVVDDLRPQRALARALLRSLGYRVLTASNEYEALNILEGKTVDLVLLDMNMGEENDGVNLYRKIVAKIPGQACMLVSGSTPQAQLEEARKIGCDAFIPKPFSRLALGRAVRAQLDKRK